MPRAEARRAYSLRIPRAKLQKYLWEHFLTAKQIGKLAYTPDMILAFTHYALRHLRPGDRLRWYSRGSLNGRPLQPFVEEDGTRLAEREVSLRPTDFVHALEQTLPSDPRALLSAARDEPPSSP